MAFSITSPAFSDGGSIPRAHVRAGGNLSPPLAWNDPPPGTRSFALVVEDPDAPSGTFHHWAVYDIGPEHTALQPGLTPEEAPDIRCGVNDFGSVGYEGPQPPKGDDAHRYLFRLAALDVGRLDVPEGADADAVWEAARPHILAETALMGTFQSP